MSLIKGSVFKIYAEIEGTSKNVRGRMSTKYLSTAATILSAVR